MNEESPEIPKYQRRSKDLLHKVRQQIQNELKLERLKTTNNYKEKPKKEKPKSQTPQTASEEEPIGN